MPVLSLVLQDVEVHAVQHVQVDVQEDAVVIVVEIVREHVEDAVA